jgi:hypothetical protein
MGAVIQATLAGITIKIDTIVSYQSSLRFTHASVSLDSLSRVNL